MGRLVVVGNIDGDYTWVASQLEEVGLHPGDRVYFLGNHVGSADQSADVIEDLIRIHPFRKTYHITGDKDLAFRDWLMHGVGDVEQAIVDSYNGNDIPYEHLRFLMGMFESYTVSLPHVDYVMSHRLPEKREPNVLYVVSAEADEYTWIDKNILNVGKTVTVLDTAEHVVDFRRFHEND